MAGQDGKVRVQFDLTPEYAEELERIVQETGLLTRAELIRRALHLYQVLYESGSDGMRVELRHGLPIFSEKEE